MLDSRITPYIKPALRPLVKTLHRCGIHPDHLTVAGFALGLLAVPAIIAGWYTAALIAIVCNRLLDGLDGELARFQQSSSSAGGFLDICLDFLFYAAIPLAFGLADPAGWGPPALVLIAAFIGTGSSFLAFAIAAEKYQIDRPQFSHKSFYYMQGLTEGTETIAIFVAFCLFPQWFGPLAYGFALACFITVFTRIYGGYMTLKKVAQHG